MTEYVVLFVGDADRWWTTMSLEERKAGYTEFQRFGAELTRRGHQIVGGAELHSTADAKRIAPGAVPSPTARSPRSPSRSAVSTRSAPTTSTT
ncbi:hypothetical protein [Barrientosiimonas endolithica]|uniref:YCII-related domain-containing protein n=1 Tax=Barrientosiimonas endolithica TaxID=1535208 RepID=A0ABN6YS66_9MICO|nr:hypothetical protein [Barrientosiimonas endolithica]BDZ59991.1 hypothetical protein GCM10025872_36480 [Barrientosiimonas endolithica]